MKKRRIVVAPLLLGAAAFAFLSLAVRAPATPVDAASCAGQALQPVGAAQLSTCGIPKLSANPALIPELHYANRGDDAGVASEADQPRANAHLGRSGRNLPETTAGGGGAAGQLPPRKTIDITQLPPELVSPSR